MREMQTDFFIDKLQEYMAFKEQPEKILEHVDEVMTELCHEVNVGYNLTKPLFQDDYNVLKNLLITICNAHIAICKSEPYYMRIEGKDKSEYQW